MRFDANDDQHRAFVATADEGEQVVSAVEISDTRFETGRRRIREALVGSDVAGRFTEMVTSSQCVAATEPEDQ